MCVIIAKTKGNKLPNKNVLRKAAMCNPHGFGFVSDTTNYKSMDFEDFMAHLEKVGENENCIIHFRYATQGSRKTANCHPFNGKDKNGNDVWFAHNGVLPYYPEEDITDSQYAFENFVLPTINLFGIDSKQAKREINDIRRSSRFAILYNEKIHLFGDYHKMSDGCYYSNLNFIRW